MKPSTVKLPCALTTNKNVRGRITSYTASLANVTAQADTAEGAREALGEEIARTLADLTDPVVMLGWEGDVWIASPYSTGGWGYSINRRVVRADGSASHEARGSITGGSGWARKECVETMRAHWYACNVEPIVNGIVALATDTRRWSCPRCRYTTTSGAPYRCQAPRCGAEACEWCGGPVTDMGAHGRGCEACAARGADAEGAQRTREDYWKRAAKSPDGLVHRDGCEHGTDAAECAMARERSVAGASDMPPACATHGDYDGGPERDA